MASFENPFQDPLTVIKPDGSEDTVDPNRRSPRYYEDGDYTVRRRTVIEFRFRLRGQNATILPPPRYDYVPRSPPTSDDDDDERRYPLIVFYTKNNITLQNPYDFPVIVVTPSGYEDELGPGKSKEFSLEGKYKIKEKEGKVFLRFRALRGN